ncbi:hypothetical protein C5167_024387 [Papaver somniferum]|uniref:Uncharacterized protein n=1 Tax=Papaver somniferum TaxID=3469 RepID=A0A4Y7JS43_PAPSO|nr:hypothetical protein C5167_024387 [Papaver somniferum]
MVDVLGSCQQGLFTDFGNQHLSNLDSQSRVEFLRARFSGTIIKSEILLELKDEKNESLRLQKEKVLMEKMRLQQLVYAPPPLLPPPPPPSLSPPPPSPSFFPSKTKLTSAKNRAAAEIASRKNREAKLQRQRDRAAARRALEELEKNVVVEDWHKTYKDFLTLISSNETHKQDDCPLLLNSSGVSIR